MTGEAGRSRDRPELVALGAAVVLVGIVLARIVMFGWQAPSPDHARYVFAGLALLDGRGFVNEAGSAFLYRSPAYPLILAAPHVLAGWAGTQFVALILSTWALVVAIAYAQALGGAPAAIATVLAIASVGLIWDQVPSVGIDLPQAGLLVSASICLWRPTLPRWLLGGVVLAMAILLKETCAPAAVLLPLAWLPVWSDTTWRRWVALVLPFWLVIILVAGWWWLYVFDATGDLFPLNSLAAIVESDDPGTWAIDFGSVTALAFGAVVWAVALHAWGADVRMRLLSAVGLSMAPAAVAVIAYDQPLRSLTPATLATCAAAGAAVAALWHRGLDPGRVARPAALASLLALLAAAILGQLWATRATDDPHPHLAAGVIAPKLELGDAVVSTFRYRSALGVELFASNTEIRLLPVRTSDGVPAAADLMWLGERDGRLFEIRRSDWAAVLGRPEVAFAAFGQPHALTPDVLVSYLAGGAGGPTGLELLLDAGDGPGITVFRVDPEAAAHDSARLPLTAVPQALTRWLDRASAAGRPDPVAEVLAARPIVRGARSDLAALASRLGEGACFVPWPLDDRRWFRIFGRVSDPGRCVDLTEGGT